MHINENYKQRNTSKFHPTQKQLKKYSDIMKVKQRKIDTDLIFFAMGLIVIVKILIEW